MFTAVSANGAEHDFLLDADGATPLSAVAGCLADELRGARAVLYHGASPMPEDMTLADSPLRDGSRIGLDHALNEDAGGQQELVTPRSARGLEPQRPEPQPDENTMSGPTAALSLLGLLALGGGITLAVIVDALYSILAVAGFLTLGLAGAMDNEKLEQSRRSQRPPSPAELMEIASGQLPRLWRRQRTYPDYLVLRVGQSAPRSGDNPVTVSLAESGAIGLTGSADLRQAVANWLVAQVATLHSPNNVRIVLLTTKNREANWSWIRWLPHCRPLAGQAAVALVGNDPGTTAARLAEVLETIGGRQAPGRRRDREPAPDFVVIVDNEVSRLPADAPAAGVFAIHLADTPDLLPADCRTVISVSDYGQVSVSVSGGSTAATDSPDIVSLAWAERIARTLAPIREAEVKRLPDAVRLLDLLDIKRPTGITIADRWRQNGSTKALIGMTDSGPLAVDLVADGPHALIAGTTGSGKSELLQAMVASLAAANRPDQMTFLLVDYKGGSAFSNCADLPHTVALLTDLDAHTVRRAVQSLSAELTRREYLLRAAGAKDIEEYALQSQNGDLEPLPRLLIVVDEFAAMVAVLPEFVSELVEIARRGRSLGIHLILATQRPAGVVTSDIRANTNLRMALRMVATADSTDVIEAPDAASIPASAPGRGFLRAGYGRTLVPFQAARVGGSFADKSVGLTPLSWADLGRPPVLPRRRTVEHGTDLESLVGAIGAAYRHLGLKAPVPPLQPPLPATVLLADLPAPRQPAAEGTLPPVPYGIEDIPSEQRQQAAAIDFASFGHLLAAGALHTGRTKLLVTIAGSIAARCSCADVHIYAIDYSGDGLLAPVAELPHCGALVNRVQADRTDRLIRRLRLEVRRRQELLAEAGFGTIGEQRAAVPAWRRLPHVVVLLNRWEAFVDAFEESEHLDLVRTIFHDGARVGVHLVITGGRVLLTERIAAMADDKLVFRLDDPSDYGLAGLRPGWLPSEMVSGRVLHAGSGIEAQVALLDGEPTWQGQADALRKLTELARRRDAEVELAGRPFQVDEILLASDRFHVGDAQGRPVGREDVLAWLRDRHATGSSVALLGPRRAGKTWVLTELSRRLVQDGSTQVHQVTMPQLSSPIETPDAFAELLDRRVRGSARPAEELLDDARARPAADRLVYLLDEVGRLVDYGPAAVSWLRDLGQAGAWLIYTGTEKDWHTVVRWALTAPGSSFGNDVNARILGPIDRRAALRFLIGTAANLRVELQERTGQEIVELTDAWPFYLQVMGDAAVRVAQSGGAQSNDARALTQDGAVRRLAEQRLLDEWTHHFQARWAEVGALGRAALLQNPGLTPTSLTPGQRDDLRDAGLLRPGDVWLADRPYFDWIARNATTLLDGERQL